MVELANSQGGFQQAEVNLDSLPATKKDDESICVDIYDGRTQRNLIYL